MLSHALLPPFVLDSWGISCPHTAAPLISLSTLRLENIVSFWRAFSPNRVSFHNSAAYKGGSYFQPRKNNSDTFTAVCRLMDLDKQHKDGEEYSVFLGFMRKMADLESVWLYSRLDALQTFFCLHFYLSNGFFTFFF